MAALAESFGPLPAMTIDRIGYGAGDADLSIQPNVLRLVVGHTEPTTAGAAESDEVLVLETNLDDVTGELIGYCCQELLAAGALDVFTTAVQMKKNRPGVQITVLATPADAHRLEAILFRETGTLGIRRTPATRGKLARQPHTVATPWGEIMGKLASLADGTQVFSPEFESCRRVAEAHNVPLRQVFLAAGQAYRPPGADK